MKKIKLVLFITAFSAVASAQTRDKHVREFLISTVFHPSFECGTRFPNLSPVYIRFFDTSFLIQLQYVFAMAPNEELEGVIDLSNRTIITGKYKLIKDTILLFHKNEHYQEYYTPSKVYGIEKDTITNRIDTFKYSICGINPSLKYLKSVEEFVDTNYNNCIRIFESKNGNVIEKIKITTVGYSTTKIHYTSNKLKSWIHLSLDSFMFSPWAGFEAKFPNDSTVYKFTPAGIGTYSCKNMSTEETQLFIETN